jgi:DnaJ-class molecular chaperone
MRDGGQSFHQDFYNVLGLNKRKAQQEDVYAAYRKMAIRWHPDKPDNRDRQGEAKSRFSEIAEAYSVLIDDKKRDEYDKKGSYELPEVTRHSPATADGLFSLFPDSTAARELTTRRRTCTSRCLAAWGSTRTEERPTRAAPWSQSSR